MGTPPHTSLSHAVEDQDYVPKAARDPRTPLQPLPAARVHAGAPGQDAALRGMRQAADSDRRRYPAEDEKLKRETREADLRTREAAREVEEQRQRREAEALERSRQAEAERRRDEDSLFAAAERQRRAAAQADSEAEQRRRRVEAEQQRRREEAEQLKQQEEEKKHREEEQVRQTEEAERCRRAKAESAAAAAAEAEQRRREAKELDRAQREVAEVEARRMEAKEAEELARERREAEERMVRDAQPEEKEKESSEIVNALVALRRRYKEDPEGLATCLKTLGTYIRNLANSPQEAKYQQINTENNAFQKRVAPFEGSTAVLAACGFSKSGASLAVDAEFLKSKGPRLFDAVAKIDVLVAQLQR